MIEGLSATNRLAFRNLLWDAAGSIEDDKNKKGYNAIFCCGVQNYWNLSDTTETPVVKLMLVFTELVSVLVDKVLPALNRGENVILEGYLADIYAAYAVRYDLEDEYNVLRHFVEFEVLSGDITPDVTFLRWEGEDTTFGTVEGVDPIEAGAGQALKTKVLYAYQRHVLDHPNVFTVVDVDVAENGTTASIVQDALDEVFEMTESRALAKIWITDEVASYPTDVGKLHDTIYKELVVGKGMTVATEYAILTPPASGTLELIPENPTFLERTKK